MPVSAKVPALLALALLASCREPSREAEPAAPSESPLAKAVPAPLSSASAPVPVGSLRPLLSVDAGVGLARPRADRELPPDVGARDLGGLAGTYTLRGEGAWTAPRSPDVAPAPLEALRKKLEGRLAFETTASRARVALQRAFLVPEGVELRLRNDLLGAVLVAGGGGRYRALPPGSLRTFFGEGRFDVVPLAAATTQFEGAEEPRRLEGKGRHVPPSKRTEGRIVTAELSTRSRTVRTDRGTVTLHVATVEGAGEGGVLLCRLFLDLVDASPDLPACGLDEVPVRAELHLAGAPAPYALGVPKGIAFVAEELVRREGRDAREGAREGKGAESPFLAPPTAAALLREPLATGPGRLMASVAELEELKGHPEPDSPGLTVRNGEGRPLVLWLEGVPVASVGPGESLVLPGLARGRYTVQFRSPLGDVVLPYAAVTVPGTASPRPLPAENDAGPR